MSTEAMKLALEALEAVSMEMTVGERYTNAGQQVLDAIDLLRVALSQQPATPEPVAWNSIQIASWIGSQLMHEPSMFERAAVCKFVRSLGRHPTLLKHSPKIHPAPSVPKDHQIAALVNKVRDIARMFHDHQSLRERIAMELVPALKASQEVKSNAERYRFILAAADDMTTSRYKSLCELLGVAITEDFDLGAAIDAAMRAAKERP